MRILYYHQHFSTPAGSTGTRSYEFARRLVARGHGVTLVCGSYRLGRTGLTQPFRHGRRQGLVDGIEVIEFELPYANRDSFLRRTLTFLKFAWRSAGVALSRDYDLIFATSTPLTAGIPGILARWLRRKPFVFEVRDLWPELPRAMGVITNPLMLNAMALLEWASYRSARGCIGLAPGMIDGIRRHGLEEARLEMIPNGCDLTTFRPGPGSGSGQPFRAVFAGSHGLANGLDALLDAAGVLKARDRGDIELHFIGDGRLKPTLQDRAAAQGLDNCRFRDPLPKAELARELGGMDAGLQILADVPAFYYGTSPNKFFDYVAAGLPVINNYPGWLADLIHRHDCGLAVPPRHPEALADALERLADHREDRLRMGHNARRLAEQSFDRAMLADRFVEALERWGRQ